MATQCTPTQLPFHPFGRREVVAQRVHGLALGYEDLVQSLTLDRRRTRSAGVTARSTGFQELKRIVGRIRQRCVVRGDSRRRSPFPAARNERSDPLLALAAGKADPTGLRRGRTSPRRCREQPETPVSSPAGRRRPPSGRIEHRFVARNRPQPPNQGQRPE